MKELFEQMGKDMNEFFEKLHGNPHAELGNIRQSKLFRIHASQCHKIMGETGLTEKQMKELSELTERHQNPTAKPLTDIMKANMKALQDKYNNPELPTTCTSYLKEYYAGDHEEFWSKETNKGNVVEQDNIDFAARVLGYGLAKKNEINSDEYAKQNGYEPDEYMIGACDSVLIDAILETKAPWNKKTLQQNIYGIDNNNEYQLRCYLRLYRKDKGILFYGLQDTPATEYEDEVIYSDLPDKDRWIAYQINRDETIEQQIIDRVKLCRAWLNEYHTLVTTSTGRVHQV